MAQVGEASLSLLLQKAVAAEEALKDASDAAKARTEAQAAWHAVADLADEARQTWLAEQEATATQAENWRGIAEAAKAGVDGIWKNIAGANQQFWTQGRHGSGRDRRLLAGRVRPGPGGENRVKGFGVGY
ncbi:hypothetical protein ACFYO0_38720 [Streptomyces sp. NPDC006365]|uniref:hypothetical protein n=1 Tax=Streptomyces sp. NPDC006365 TaxID=3364744 RepID=UPI0036905AA0